MLQRIDDAKTRSLVGVPPLLREPSRGGESDHLLGWCLRWRVGLRSHPARTRWHVRRLCHASGFGGNLDEYWQVFAARDPITAGSDNSTGVWSFFDTAYDPLMDGAIASIDMSLDHIQLGGGSGGGLNPALIQGGVHYVASGISMGEQTWTSRSFLGLLEGSFFDLDTRTLHPDFSSSGGEINFGWRYVVSSASGDPVMRTVGFDNWSLEVIPVPEPSTLGLVAIGLAGVGLRGRVERARRRVPGRT